MKLLTAEDEAKFYRYAPDETRPLTKDNPTNSSKAQQSKKAQSAASSA
jgi:hypothetical protein